MAGKVGDLLEVGPTLAVVVLSDLQLLAHRVQRLPLLGLGADEDVQLGLGQTQLRLGLVHHLPKGSFEVKLKGHSSQIER